MGVSREQSTSNCPKNEHFLPPDTHTYVRFALLRTILDVRGMLGLASHWPRKLNSWSFFIGTKKSLQKLQTNVVKWSDTL